MKQLTIRIILSLSIFAVGFGQTAAAASASCIGFYGGKSALDAELSYWDKWVRYFETQTKGVRNPFEGLVTESDEIGKVHNRFRAEIKSYKYIFMEKLNKGPLDERIYRAIQNTISKELQTKFVQNQTIKPSKDALFAGLYVSRWIKERKVEVLAEQARQEQLKQQEQQKKEDEQKKKNQQQQQDQQQDQQQNGQGQQQKGQQSQQDQKKQEQKQDKKQDDKKDDGKDGDSKDKPPKQPWKKSEEEKYKPHNKEMPDSDPNGGKKEELLSTNGFLNPKRFHNYRLFAEKYFDQVSSADISESPMMRPRNDVVSTGSGSYYSNIKTFDATSLVIPKQYGFEPIAGDYGSFSVAEKQIGVFEVIGKKGKLENSIKVPLRPSSKISATEQQKKNKEYTIKSGINPKLWPDHIQIGIQEAKEKGGNDPLKVAAILEAYISTQGPYMYYTKKGKELSDADIQKTDQLVANLSKSLPMPVAMAHAKVFNCDGSAWIGALLLRDVLGIPARIVGGRTGDGLSSSGKETLLAMSDQSIPHMWVEVLHDGQWHPFDFTPKKNEPQPDSKDNKDDQSSDKNDKDQNKDQKDQNKKDSESQKDGDQQSADKQQQGKEASKKEKGQQGQGNKDDSKQDSDDQSSSPQDSDGQSGGKKDGDNQQGNDQKSGSEKDGQDADGKAKDAAEGERRFKERQGNDRTDNPPPPYESIKKILVEEIEKQAHVDILNSNKKGKILEKIGTMLQQLRRGSMDSIMSDLAKKIWVDTKPIVDLGDRSLGEILRDIQNALLTGKLEKAYYEAFSLHNALTAMAKSRRLNDDELKLQENINRLLVQMKAIRHASSEHHELVNRIINSLPGPISRSALKKTYGDDIQTLGTAAQAAIAGDFINGKLASYVQMGLLSKYVDLFLNSEKIPRYKDEKTLMRSTDPKPSQDLVVAKSPLEFAKMLFNPNPGEHLFEKLYRGEQFAMGPRETIRKPDPRQPLERKVSVVLYDITPSMFEREGTKFTIQESLLKAFVDNALKEKDTFGNSLHEVIVIPFDVRPLVHHEIVIKTSEDARRFVMQPLLRPKSQGGTKIQPGIEYFYDRVEEVVSSLGKGDRRFAKANLVLMSDGGSEVDKSVLETRQKGLPKELKTTFNFLAIGETNSDLISLAQAAVKITGQSFYHHIDHSEINAILKESNRPRVNADAFATDNLRPNGAMVAAIEDAIAHIGKLGEEPNTARIFEMKNKLKKGENISLESSRLLIIDFDQVVATLIQSSDMDKSLRQKIIQNILEQYPRIVGRSLSHMSHIEVGIFEKLFAWGL